MISRSDVIDGRAPAEARKPEKLLFCVVDGERVTGVEDETMNPQNLEELSKLPRLAQLLSLFFTQDQLVAPAASLKFNSQS